jgi:hypothetical protein
MVHTYLGLWIDFFMHGLPNVSSTIDGFRILLSQKPINGLLQYLQIIIVDGKVVIQLFCKQFMT